MNTRRGFLFSLLAVPMAIGIRQSPYTYGPDGSISIRFNRPMKRRDYIRDGNYLPYRVRECHRYPDGTLKVLRVYGVMGTTGYQKVGDIIDRPVTSKGDWTRNYATGSDGKELVFLKPPMTEYDCTAPVITNDRYVVGRVTRVATEAEFMELHRHWADALANTRIPGHCSHSRATTSCRRTHCDR